MKNALYAVALLFTVALIAAPHANAQGWWETDPEGYQAFVNLEQAEPQVVIDGVAKDGETIKVKPGSIIEVHFAEMYRGEEVWWFAGAKGEIPESTMFMIDFQTKFENGRALIHEPGTKLFKFRAPDHGKFALGFKYGKRVKVKEQLNQPFTRLVTVFIEVE